MCSTNDLFIITIIIPHITCPLVLDISIFNDEQAKLDEPCHQRKRDLHIGIEIQLACLTDLAESWYIFISALCLLASLRTTAPSQLIYLQSHQQSICIIC